MIYLWALSLGLLGEWVKRAETLSTRSLEAFHLPFRAISWKTHFLRFWAQKMVETSNQNFQKGLNYLKFSKYYAHDCLRKYLFSIIEFFRIYFENLRRQTAFLDVFHIPRPKIPVLLRKSAKYCDFQFSQFIWPWKFLFLSHWKKMVNGNEAKNVDYWISFRILEDKIQFKGPKKPEMQKTVFGDNHVQNIWEFSENSAI